MLIDQAMIRNDPDLDVSTRTFWNIVNFDASLLTLALSQMVRASGHGAEIVDHQKPMAAASLHELTQCAVPSQVRYS